MSELKAVHAFDVYEAYTKTGDDDAAQVYLKYEADKVIAEKDAEIAELENRIDDGDKDFEIADHQNERLLKIVRHQKYKRCINKAEWCEERCARYDLLQEHSGFSWRREIDFYFGWYLRWLELANKIKDKEA